MLNINLVVVGHVDHGKSTLIGRLLYDTNSLKEKKMEEIQKIADEYKKKFEFAHLMDSLEEEVKEEKTIDTTQVIFKGKNYYTIIDAPGHKEFLKNMLTGASFAQAAVLVVSAVEGVQEQTKRHLFLLKFLGLNHLFICINKLDLKDYEKQVFDQVKAETINFLQVLQYRPKRLSFIPISALNGDNIYVKSANIPWYRDFTLIEALDEIEVNNQTNNEKTRFVVQDIYDIDDNDQVIVGRVEAGKIKKDDSIVFSADGFSSKIKEIRVFNQNIAQALPGDNIGIVLQDKNTIKRGEVAGLMASPPQTKTRFNAEMFLLTDRLQLGESLILKCSTQRTSCAIKKILQKIDSATGLPMNEDPDSLSANESALVEFETASPIVVESFSQIPALGRFVIEKNHKNIAAGIIP